VPTYGRVEYQDVYPGIDLVYYGNQRQLEYDFVVHPGASPDTIALNFAGADQVAIDGRGDLVVSAGGQTLRQHRPVVFQEVNSTPEEVSGQFVLLSSPPSALSTSRVGFQTGSYDPTRPLVIDPVLSYSTYLGGSDLEDGFGIAVDSQGSAYVTGVTSSAD